MWYLMSLLRNWGLKYPWICLRSQSLKEGLASYAILLVILCCPNSVKSTGMMREERERERKKSIKRTLFSIPPALRSAKWQQPTSEQKQEKFRGRVALFRVSKPPPVSVIGEGCSYLLPYWVSLFKARKQPCAAIQAEEWSMKAPQAESTVLWSFTTSTLQLCILTVTREGGQLLLALARFSLVFPPSVRLFSQHQLRPAASFSPLLSLSLHLC